MNPSDLIDMARLLVESGKAGAPRQSNLRGATSSVYYALFHCLARCVADSLAGATKASRSERAWRQAYRSLEHGEARKKFQDGASIKFFSGEYQDFATLFTEMQMKRHEADYDPAVKFRKETVLRDIERVENMIEVFLRISSRDRRDFAIYTVMKRR